MWWLIVKNDELSWGKQKKHHNWKEKGTQFQAKNKFPQPVNMGGGVEWPLNVWKIKLHCSRQVPTVFQNIIAQNFFGHLIPE